MSYQVHILTKEHLSGSKFDPSFQKAAEELGFPFDRKSDCDEIFAADYKTLLRLSYNTRDEYNYSLRENYYPNYPGYGANVIISYGYGSNEDALLLPFLRKALDAFPQVLIYANENGANDQAWTVAELQSSDETDAYTFFTSVPGNSAPLT